MYQSIYRKYRPQTFAQVYGQDAISKTLTNAVLLDRVAHAYLFSGPRGTGKTTTAKLLAKALNCTHMVDGVICDDCEDCQLIKEGSHPDVIEIDAASNNGVDEVRELIEKVKYAPIKGKKKVYIIDEVHMMTQGAFNALLKTLEEPPDHVCFILATTELHKVLPTIKSRCQKFTFKKIQAHDIVACMKDILDKEQATYDEESLNIIASISDGGMRDALSTLEQVMIFSNNNITKELTYEALDLVSKDKINELYDLILSKDLDASIEYVNELNKNAVDFKQVINELIAIAMQELIKQPSNKSFLLNMVEQLDDSIAKLKYDDSKKLYLELAIIKSINYLNTPTTQPVAQVQQAVNTEPVKTPIQQFIAQNMEKEEKPKTNSIKENYKRVLSSIPSEPVEETPKQPAYQSIVSDDELLNVLVHASKPELHNAKGKWNLIDDLMYRDDTKQHASYLQGSQPVAACNEAIIVVTHDYSEAKLVNSTTNAKAIANVMSKIFGSDRYVLAVTADQWTDLRKKYIELNNAGNLPQPKEILKDVTFVQVDGEQEQPEDGLLVFGKKIFKDKLHINKQSEVNNYEY